WRVLLANLSHRRSAGSPLPTRFPLLPEHSAGEHRSSGADPDHDPAWRADRAGEHHCAGNTRGRGSGRHGFAAVPRAGRERHDPRVAIRFRFSASLSRRAGRTPDPAMAATGCCGSDANLPEWHLIRRRRVRLTQPLRAPLLVFGGPYSNLRALTALRARAAALGIDAAHT